MGQAQLQTMTAGHYNLLSCAESIPPILLFFLKVANLCNKVYLVSVHFLMFVYLCKHLKKKTTLVR